MTGITVGRDGDVLVAIKTATDPDHRARLRDEAALLERIDHPGVVRYVDFAEGPPATLRTAFVGPDSWRTSTATVAAFAALTATIADLHDSGLAHSNLRAEHVLLDADQRPILCGFADAGAATIERVQADRSMLASMLRDQANHHPNPESHRLRNAAEVLEESALPTRAAIRILDEQPSTAPAPRTPHHRTTLIAGTAAALAAIGSALVGIIAWFHSNPPPTATMDTSDLVPTTTGASAPTASRPPPTTSSVRLNDPAVIVVHGGRRYRVGAIGDLIRIADWTCDGLATPAVLRPGTGELAVFTSWPDPYATLLPPMTTVVDEAIEFNVDNTPCPELRIRTVGGSRLIEIPS